MVTNKHGFRQARSRLLVGSFGVQYQKNPSNALLIIVRPKKEKLFDGRNIGKLG